MPKRFVDTKMSSQKSSPNSSSLGSSSVDVPNLSLDFAALSAAAAEKGNLEEKGREPVGENFVESTSGNMSDTPSLEIGKKTVSKVVGGDNKLPPREKSKLSKTNPRDFVADANDQSQQAQNRDPDGGQNPEGSSSFVALEHGLTTRAENAANTSRSARSEKSSEHAESSKSISIFGEDEEDVVSDLVAQGCNPERASELVQHLTTIAAEIAPKNVLRVIVDAFRATAKN